jgi:hypothetical protein
MEFVELFNKAWPPLVGALAAYLAIREDLARLKEISRVHQEEIERLREWRERVMENSK